MPKLTVRVTQFHSLRRGTLVGFATIYITEMHMAVSGVAVHQHSAGAHWARLPSRPVIDSDGNPRRTSDGRIEYAKVFSFDSRTVSDAFSTAVVRALLEFNPAAFDESAA